MDIKNKIVIVTGGAHGIGRALCRAFHTAGAEAVVVADLDADGAQAVADELSGLAVQCDVSKEENIQNLVAKTHEKYGRVDIFVSNAGIGVTDGPSWTAAGSSNEGWQKCWEVNVMSQVYAARAVLPEMQARGEGYLLNTASAAGLLAQMGDAAYTATKHASVAFAKSLALTHGHEGIGVSILCPQYVATSMTGIPDESDNSRFTGMLEAEDVAQVCIKAIESNTFMVLSHPVVKKYVQFMTADYEKWIAGMQDLRASLVGDADELSMDMFIRTAP